jgi:hypothetical protein
MSRSLIRNWILIGICIAVLSPCVYADPFFNIDDGMIKGRILTELVTVAAAAYTDTTISIPANAMVYGVRVSVDTVIPTASTFTVTGATSTTEFSPVDGPQLATNSGMEDGNPPAGWTATDSPQVFERSDIQKHSGSYSAHVSVTTADTRGIYNITDIAVGKTYKVSFWVYLVSGELRIDYRLADSSGPYATINTTGSWVFWEYIATEKPGTDTNALFLRSSAQISEFYIDDFSVTEVGGISTVAGSTDLGTTNCPYKNGAAQKIRITPNAAPAAATGKVLVTIFYWLKNPSMN